MNKFDDIWFWELDLINYFFGDLLEQIFNFYQGPLKLTQAEQILMNECGENDLHIVSFLPGGFSDPEALKKLKTFRKYSTKNTDKFFHFKYWVVEDEALAQQIGINTSQPGDIYLLRQAETVFNASKPNVNLCDFPYSSERLLKAEDLVTNIEQSYARIV